MLKIQPVTLQVKKNVEVVASLDSELTAKADENLELATAFEITTEDKELTEEFLQKNKVSDTN